MNNSYYKICPLCSGPGRFFYLNKRDARSYDRCDSCQLVWLVPKHHLPRDQEHAHYNTHQNDPADTRYRDFLNRLWQPLKIKLPKYACGLDYGSGPGPTLHLMAQHDGFNCRHYDPCFHPDKSVFEQQYDFITCSEAAEHFHYPADEFRLLKALLKPGGWLGIMTSRLSQEISFENWHYRVDPTHVAFYSDHTFRSITRRFGFKPPEFISNTVVLLQAE